MIKKQTNKNFRYRKGGKSINRRKTNFYCFQATFWMIPRHSYPPTSKKEGRGAPRLRGALKTFLLLGRGEEWFFKHTKKINFFYWFFLFFLSFLMFFRHFWTFWKILIFLKHSRFFMKNRKILAHYSQQILMIPIIEKDEKTNPHSLRPRKGRR